MEKGDLELGEVDLIQDTVKSLLDCAENNDNHKNQFSQSIYMAPDEIKFTMEENTVQSILDCVKKEQSHTNQHSPSIFMVPQALRDHSPSLFNPRVVSIGPLHREDENVQAFEGRKANYLINLMSFINSPQEDILNLCVQKVYASMEKIKACYVWTKTYSDAQIAKMMVMDACFILGFSHELVVSGVDSYLGEMLLFQNIIYDLVLLENQIPLFVLEEIFQCTILKYEPSSSLIGLINPILKCLSIFKADIKTDNISIDTTHHILGLLHECYKPRHLDRVGFLTTRIHSVVDLERTGVSFKPNRDPTWELEMKVKLYRFQCFFGPWGKPTFKIPELIIDHFTELVLRNLIAYEQSCETYNHIISYASTMDMLVNTQEDVAKLVHSGALQNCLGSNEEAANMINSICKDVAAVFSFYEQEWIKLNKYCNGYWPKNIAWLRRTYFGNPWNIIALIAGIILFALTVIQTIFSVNPVGNNN